MGEPEPEGGAVKQVRLGQGCRSCGIMSPDVGHTTDGDLLCDSCDEQLARTAGRLIWEGFLRDRVCFADEADDAREAAKAAHLRRINRELLST